MRVRTGSLGIGIGLAGLFAGPAFVAAMIAAEAYRQMPQAIELGLSLENFGMLFMSLFVIVPVGAIIALPVLVVGAPIMARLADSFDLLRLPGLWAVAGAAMIGLPLLLLEGGDIVTFGFAMTGAICARLCRQTIDWVDEAEARSPWID